MIRVFPRRTKWTPTDELAFVGDPPLFRPPERPVYISCCFTWDRMECERLARSWLRFYPDVRIGGPAYDDEGSEFIPGRFLKSGAIITSRGCIRNCKHCFVPEREGRLREYPIYPGWNVMDNNLLACSKSHLESVFNMLRDQNHEIHFSGGLDSLLFNEWHVKLLKSIRLKFAFFACDYPGAEKHLEKVKDLMSDFPRQSRRCYVMIGFNGESLLQAEKRLEKVFELKFDPFAMLFRDKNNEIKWSQEWRDLQRKWCRPAAYRKNESPKIQI